MPSAYQHGMRGAAHMHMLDARVDAVQREIMPLVNGWMVTLCACTLCLLQEIPDFQWCPHDPWFILSTGVLCPNADYRRDNGYEAQEPLGSLHVWCPTQLLTMPKEQAHAALEQHM